MKEGKEQLDKEKSFSNDGHCGTYRSKYEILHSGWINRQHSSNFGMQARTLKHKG